MIIRTISAVFLIIGRFLRLAEDIQRWFDEESLRESKIRKLIRSQANPCVSHSTSAYFIPIQTERLRLNLELIKTLRIAYPDDTKPLCSYGSYRS